MEFEHCSRRSLLGLALIANFLLWAVILAVLCGAYQVIQWVAA